MVGAVRSAGSTVLSAVVNSIQALPGKLLAFGRQAITSLGNAIQAGVSLLKSKATALSNSVVNGIKALPSKMLSIGRDIVYGIGNGLANATGWLIGKIKSLCTDSLDAIKAFFKIGSPSKLMRDEVGRWLPAGIGVGIEKYGYEANKAMANMARNAVGAANAEFNGSSLNLPGANGTTGAPGTGSRGGVGATYVFNQYNNSPKALSRKDIYRQTKNALKFATSNA
jgi:phage-related protein